jgi:general secretion pathway protein B
MSYILDALKRAEVERERGSVPGLHSHPIVSYDEVDDASSLTWVWLLVAAVLIAAGGAGWWWWRTTAPLAPVKEPTPAAKVPATEAPAVAATLPPMQTLTSVTPATVVIQSAPPALAPATAVPKQVAAKPAPTTTLSSAPSPATTSGAGVAVVPVPALAPAPVSKPTPAPVTQPPRIAAANPPRVAATPAGSGIPLFSELPDALRRQIPPLTISGAVYSDDPAQRMLLVNNQAFGQGNAVAPGVLLEEIQPNSSVFIFQGTRFQLDH